MENKLFPDPLAGVLARVDALRDGLTASTGLSATDALAEAVLLLDHALERSRSALTKALVHGDGLTLHDVRLLLAAERYWLEILRDILVAGDDLTPPDRLHRVLAALPG